MGKKKIEIKYIKDDKKRCSTFKKRKFGLLKKAKELSILCGANVHITMKNIETNLSEKNNYTNKRKTKEKKVLETKNLEKKDEIDLSFLNKYEKMEEFDFEEYDENDFEEYDENDFINDVIFKDVYLF